LVVDMPAMMAGLPSLAKEVISAPGTARARPGLPCGKKRWWRDGQVYPHAPGAAVERVSCSRPTALPTGS